MNRIRIKALVWHYLNTVKRNKGRLIDLLVWPFLDVLVFGFTAKFVSQSTGFSKITAIFLGSLVFWHYFSRISSEVYQQIFDDVASKNLKNIMITPIRDVELIGALAVSALIKVGISLLVTILGVTMFYGLSQKGLNIEAWYLLVLTATGMAFGFLIASLLFMLGMKAMAFSWVITGLVQPFACVFYSRSVLPYGLKKLSYLVPVSYVFENYRGELINWIIPTAISLILLVVSVVVFLWSIKMSRRTGLLMKI